MNAGQLALYLVTDSSFLRGRKLSDVVRAAVQGGVTMVQVREKSACTRDFISEVQAVHGILRDSGVPLIVNDRIDVALAYGAEGVHIGQSDMPYQQARSLMGPDKIIGLSVESLEDVKLANSLDPDYIAVSPVFSTPTKTDTAPAFGLEGLRQAVRLSVHPCVAIGGINGSNAAEVISCGADGIAVVSALMAADDPQRAASDLLKVCKL